jgi:arylsulfatase A-like enzyme
VKDRIRYPFAVLVLLAVVCACEKPVPREQIEPRIRGLGRPHIVLVVVDTLRADWTSPYGDPHGTTPELSRWAERGIVFENVRSHSSWTKMSMASTMTSLWPRSHGIRAAEDAIGEGALTLAEVLQEAGYATYGVQTNGWLDQSFGFHQGFDHYIFPIGKGARNLAKPQIWPHADKVLAEAQRLVEDHDRSAPMFLYLHLMDVHEYAAPPEFKLYGDTPEAAYRAAIRWDDDALERIRELLSDEGMLENSILVFASDHGESFGENGKHGHARNVLTNTLLTPLVIRLPFRVDPIRVASQVRNIDLAPTLLDLVGIAVPPSFEGRSMLPLVVDPEAHEDRVNFGGLGLPLYADSVEQVSMSDGRWTYARTLHPDPDAEPTELLFDRSVDPGENVNLVEMESPQAARMRAAMDAYLAEGVAENVLETDVRIDPSIAERLRAMGYLE